MHSRMPSGLHTNDRNRISAVLLRFDGMVHKADLVNERPPCAMNTLKEPQACGSDRLEVTYTRVQCDIELPLQHHIG